MADIDNIDNTQDTIDVRDVIARFEELEAELQERHEAGQFMSDFDDWITNSIDNSAPVLAAFEDGDQVQSDIEEFYKLRELLDDLKGQGGDEEWRGAWYPVTLVKDDYFKEYAQGLAEDIGAVPKDLSWPACHIDWDAAADALQNDYTSVDYDGETYWTR